MRVLLPLAVAISLCACQPSTRSDLERISQVADPASLQLERGYNEYVSRTSLDDGTEVGVIACRDGSIARFWFKSHHLTDDHGGTLFRFSDGTELYMAGGFCCEVQLPERQFANLAELRQFIRETDGTPP